MATTKKSSTRPKISSSHTGRPAAGVGKSGKKPARPAGKTFAKKSASARPAAAAEKPRRPRPAEKPSRAAARTSAIAAAPVRAKKAQPTERTAAQEETQQIALLIAKAALDKKAVNVQIVDVVGRVDYADYLVLMSGRSDRHVLSVADGIEEELGKLTPKRKPVNVEGRPQGAWVVLDFGDVVAHVFQEEARSFYDLDTLWQDARRVPVAPESARPLA